MAAYDQRLLLAPQRQGCTRLRCGAEGRRRLRTLEGVEPLAQRKPLVDTLNQQRREALARRYVGRQATTLCARILGIGYGPTRLAQMVAALQVVPLQRAIHNVEQRQHADGPPAQILYEQHLAGAHHRPLVGRPLDKRYYKQPLRRGVYIGALTPYARHQLRDFHRHNPQMEIGRGNSKFKIAGKRGQRLLADYAEREQLKATLVVG